MAWIYIPGVEIDDPVMQAEDNGFYLNRDELREFSTWGCYYADCRNHLSSRETLDANTVIYGHSSNDCDPEGVRFTKLHRNPNPIGGELTDFFQTVERKNWLDFNGVTFSEGDTILTLSTCCRKYDKNNTGNQRLVIMAKLLPEGATEQAFTVKLTKKPEMP